MRRAAQCGHTARAWREPERGRVGWRAGTIACVQASATHPILSVDVAAGVKHGLHAVWAGVGGGTSQQRARGLGSAHAPHDAPLGTRTAADLRRAPRRGWAPWCPVRLPAHSRGSARQEPVCGVRRGRIRLARAQYAVQASCKAGCAAAACVRHALAAARGASARRGAARRPPEAREAEPCTPRPDGIGSAPVVLARTQRRSGGAAHEPGTDPEEAAGCLALCPEGRGAFTRAKAIQRFWAIIFELPMSYL